MEMMNQEKRKDLPVLSIYLQEITTALLQAFLKSRDIWTTNMLRNLQKTCKKLVSYRGKTIGSRNCTQRTKHEMFIRRDDRFGNRTGGNQKYQ